MIPTANIKNFLFTTRFPPDKIVGVYTGSFTATATTFSFFGHRSQQTIAHGFGSVLLLTTTYSLDGGVTWQDQNISIPDLSTPSVPIFQTLAVSAYSTTTDIVVVATSYLSSNQTVTYKVVAAWKD